MSGKTIDLETRQRTMDRMADDYSVRARAARVAQGLSPVLTDRGVLNRVAEMMADASQTNQNQASTAA